MVGEAADPPGLKATPLFPTRGGTAASLSAVAGFQHQCTARYGAGRRLSRQGGRDISQSALEPHPLGDQNIPELHVGAIQVVIDNAILVLPPLFHFELGIAQTLLHHFRRVFGPVTQALG